MADDSARDEVHEREANKASVVCDENIFSKEFCFVVNLVCYISLCLRAVACVPECLHKAEKSSTVFL